MHYIVYSWCNHFTFIANALQALANNNAPLSALLIKVIKLFEKTYNIVRILILTVLKYIRSFQRKEEFKRTWLLMNFKNER